MEELLALIPYGGEVVAIIVAVFSLVSAIVPDDKMPAIVSKIMNVLALNVGRAKNDPNSQ